MCLRECCECECWGLGCCVGFYVCACCVSECWGLGCRVLQFGVVEGVADECCVGVCCVHGWCVDGCYDNVSGQGGMVVCYACMVLWVVDGSF